jgi:hypothetical protein
VTVSVVDVWFKVAAAVHGSFEVVGVCVGTVVTWVVVVHKNTCTPLVEKDDMIVISE